MKTLFAAFVLALTVNVSFASELGEGAADCSSMVQSNRSDAAVVVSESVQVEKFVAF